MSLRRATVTVGVLALAALTAACGNDEFESGDTTERRVASEPLKMTAGPDDAVASEVSTPGRSGSAEVAADAVRAIAKKDAEAYCSLFEVRGKPSTPEQVTECVESTEPAMTDEMAAMAKAALKSGPDHVEEFGERSTVTYDDFDPPTIDLVKIGRDWYATHD